MDIVINIFAIVGVVAVACRLTIALISMGDWR